MKKVILPRGIPGSGKSTWVKEQLSLHPSGTAVRLNNDDLSNMLYNQEWGNMFNNASKELLHHLRLSMLETFLQQDYITHIYVDNTNLASRTVKALQDVAIKHGAEFIVVDDFLNVPIEECIERDSKRERVVGADVIRKMAEQLKRVKPWTVPETPTIEKYDNDQVGASRAIIVDIDGTLAHIVDRSPYDWSRVSEDELDEGVRHVVNHARNDSTVIVLSGRDGSCYDDTYNWLVENDIKFDFLFMREEGDNRPDWIIKYELFQKHVAGRYRIRYVLDDRDQVVNLWRNKLGLPTYQVADGDF